MEAQTVADWLSLLPGSSLQDFENITGFNIQRGFVSIRIGIVCNDCNYSCNSEDTFIGFGGKYTFRNVNVAVGNNYDSLWGFTSATFGYILAYHPKR